MTDFATRAKTDAGLIGSTVRIDQHHSHHEEKTGTVTGIGLPLVRVTVDGRHHFRHINEISLTRGRFENTVAGL